MDLNKCSCGTMPKIIFKRKLFRLKNHYIGKVVCGNCKAQTFEYELFGKNKDFLIARWNEGKIYFIDEFRNVGKNKFKR